MSVTVGFNTYSIVGSSYSSLTSLYVRNGYTYSSELSGNLYLKRYNSLTSSTVYTSFSDLVENGQVDMTVVTKVGNTSSSSTFTLTSSNISRAFEASYYGYSLTIYTTSARTTAAGTLQLPVKVLLSLSKNDSSMKIGETYTRSLTWLASFELHNSNASISNVVESVTATANASTIATQTMTTAGDFTDSVSYTYGDDTETGSRTVHVLDLTSIDLGQQEDYLITRSSSAIAIASCISTFTATYSDGTNTITETVNTSSATETTPIAYSTADNESKTAVISYRPNQYATTRTCDFYYVVTDNLRSISVSGQTTDYFVGDTFDFDGNVTANYDSGCGIGSQSYDISVSEPDMTTAGTKTVTVTYEDLSLGSEATATYEISVVPVDVSLSCDSHPSKTSYYWGYIPDETAYSNAGNSFDYSGMTFTWTDRYGTEHSLTNSSAGMTIFLKSPVDKTESHDYPIWATYTDGNGDTRTIDTGYAVSGQPLAVSSVTVNSIASTALDPDTYSTDSQQYWDNGEDKFEVPSAISITITYNNSETSACSLADITAYYGSGTVLSSGIINVVSDQLTAGTSVVDDEDYIYFSFSDPNVATIGYSNAIYGRYPVSYVEDSIDTVDVTSGIGTQIVIGNRLTKYLYAYNPTNYLSFTATYASGATKVFDGTTPAKAFQFADNDILTSEPASISVKVYGDTAYRTASNLSGNVSFSLPTMVLSVDPETPLKTKFVEDQDEPDISSVSLIATFYGDANDSATLCDYTEKIVRSDYTALVVEENSDTDLGVDLSGNAAIDLIPSGSIDVEANARIKFTASSTLQGVSSATLYIPIKSYLISNIVGITLLSAKTEYQVNDEFGTSANEATFLVRYKDTSDANQTIQMSLDNLISTINVYPIVGTTLRTVGTRTVTISSAFNSAVSVSYDITISPRTTDVASLFGKDYRVHKLTNSDMNGNGMYRFAPKDWINETLRETEYVYLSAGTYVIVPSSAINANDPTLLNGSLAESYDDEGKIVPIGYLENIYGPSDLTNGATNLSLGAVVLFNDMAPEVSGESNITIKFPCDSAVISEANEETPIRDYIDHSHALCLFGHNNSLNRLFVGANTIAPNHDFHTLEPNTSNYGAQELAELGESIYGDFTYWSEEAQATCGESDNGIIGYAVISDSQMMVFKDHSDKEARFYIRTPFLAAMRDYSGNVMTDLSGSTLTQEEYSVAQSNSKMNAVADTAIWTFNGDLLFLDEENEIAGLDIQGIVGTNQRVGATRSFYIDQALHKADMADSVLWSCGRLLYLSVPEIGTFVSDRDSLGNGQYEWWLEDYPAATCFMEWNNEAYQGDENGKLYKLRNGSYTDEERTYASNILVSVSQNVSNDTIIYSSTDITNELADGYVHTFLPTYGQKEGENDKMRFVYRRVANISYSESDLNPSDGQPAEIIVKNNLIYVMDSDTARYRVSSDYTYYLAQYPGYAYIEVDESAYEAADGYTRMTWGNEYGTAFYLEPIDLYNDDVLEDFSAQAIYKLYYLDSSGNKVYCNLSNLKRASIVRRLSDAETYIGNVGSGTFQLFEDKECTRLVDLVLYTSSYVATAFSATITHHKTVESQFVTSPFLWSSMAYGKTFKRIDILNKGEQDSNLKITFLSSDSSTTAFAVGASIGNVLDLGNFNFEMVDFTNRNTPNCYKKYLMFRDRKYLQLAIKSDEEMRSELPAMTILYSVPNKSHDSK